MQEKGNILTGLKFLLLCSLLLCLSLESVAQNGDPLVQAREYIQNKDYDKGFAILQEEYNKSPLDVYPDYLTALLEIKKYKDAEKLVNSMLKMQPRSPLILIDLGHVYELSGKDKKAEESYAQAVQLINGDDMLTQRIANAFIAIDKTDYAIKTYEKAKQLIGNVYIYNMALARLYTKAGDLEKAVDALLEMNNLQIGLYENIKSLMLELLGNDPKKLQLAQKALIKKINQQPDNTYYADLLTWLYTQKNDWDGALIQMEALDTRNKENGQRLVDFAREAVKAQQYDVAMRAYDAVTEKGKDLPFYAITAGERLNAGLRQIENDPNWKPEEIKRLSVQYDSFFTRFPQYYATETARDYALLEAQYDNNPQKGIEILTQAISLPNAKEDFIGNAKLQLGDYYLLAGKVWDASLVYSQVDKQFKQDALGESARFRNAKLAYYRGDFKWAQEQLSILKAATSDLIANDALYLSVLITENTDPDSNASFVFQRFAYADLLLFQNKDKEAETLLDSITTAYPKHALTDDILMLRAKLAEKHRDYQKALVYLATIYTEYGKDVLGDDAVFKTAEIYQQHLHDNEKARHFYEQLIIDYPGSTYIQTARSRLEEMKNAPLP